MSFPAADRVQKRCATVLDLIGNTPLLRLKRFEAGLQNVELYGKAEWFNPGTLQPRAGFENIDPSLITRHSSSPRQRASPCQQVQELLHAGGDAAICSSEDSIEEWVQKITGGEGVSYALDAVGGATAAAVAKSLSLGGRLLASSRPRRSVRR